MKVREKKKALKNLVLMLMAELLFVAVLVWLFDPFYQYHKPFFGMEAVLNDRDNQMAGTIRNFQYDSVLVGSSMVENCNSAYLEEAYGCKVLKLVRASGSVADLLYYLEMAESRQELKNVFWCVDIFAVNSSTEVALEQSTEYLRTETVLDDIPYLYNKEILLERIPAMFVYAQKGMYTGGNAYNWSREKKFGSDIAMQAYNRDGVTWDMVIVEKDYSENRPLIAENIAMLEKQIQSHPEVSYRFLFPPYSMLWWDCAYVNGELEERFYILEHTVAMLLAQENAEVYFFQDEASIVCNLDNYMDMIHYSPEINQYMLEQMKAGENRVTAENWAGRMAGMREMVERITKEEIYKYYGRLTEENN